MFKFGYQNWNSIRNYMLYDPFIKFNFNLKLKTDQELLDRANLLINCFKLERDLKKKKNKRAPAENKSKSKCKSKSKKKKKVISKNKNK
jgi:hypothetical protein